MAEPIVSARDLTKLFGAKTALDGVSIDVFPGDIVGVLGKNGAGKTTLLETLLGFSPPNGGSVTVFGEDALHMSAAAKARIGFKRPRNFRSRARSCFVLGVYTSRARTPAACNVTSSSSRRFIAGISD